MSVEVHPAGIACNLSCHYCYENPMRDAGDIRNEYDAEAVKAKAKQFGQPITLFGGEPLVAPIDIIEDLLKFSHENFGSASIQTNGALITDRHIELFKQYNASVGISVDGPDELNDIRWAGSLEKTREATQKTIANISAVRDAGISCSIIITLHKLNTGDKLPVLKNWIKELLDKGINSIRLHILEVDSPIIKKKYVLPNDEYLAVFIEMFRFEKELNPNKSTFDVPNDIRKLLLGNDQSATCVWTGCDPYNTVAVQGIGPDGDDHNCGRTNKDGINQQKSDTRGWERNIALYNTPQEYNGCKDCRFFLMCQGQCPGTAINNDWRNKSEFCSVWKGIFTYFEMQLLGEGQHPLSLSPQRQDVEKQLIESLSGGKKQYVNQIKIYNKDNPEYIAPVIINDGHGDSHGDSNNDPNSHGDSPHGDEHGDSG